MYKIYSKTIVPLLKKLIFYKEVNRRTLHASIYVRGSRKFCFWNSGCEVVSEFLVVYIHACKDISGLGFYVLVRNLVN